MSTEFQDRTLTCVDCGKNFTWSGSEQEFFRDKGFADPPKRCQPCRQAKRASHDDFDQKRGGRK